MSIKQPIHRVCEFGRLIADFNFHMACERPRRLQPLLQGLLQTLGAQGLAMLRMIEAESFLFFTDP